MKSTWYERHTVLCRSSRGIAAQDRVDLGAPILVRNPRAIATISGGWLFVFAFCMADFAIIGVVAAFMLLTMGAVVASIFVLARLARNERARSRIMSRERVRLDSRGLEYLRVDGLVRRRRVVPLAEIRSITDYTVMVGGWGNQPAHPEYGLVIKTIGRPLLVGQGRDPDEANRLQEWIEIQLREWDPAWVNVPCCADCEVMDASCTRPEAPSDSTIFCRREWDRTEFRKHLPANDWFAILLLVTLVMSGSAMVGIMFLNSLGPRLDRFHLPYLILVGSAGLFVVVPWVSWRVGNRRWVVRPGEITTSVPMLGIGWSRTIKVEWLDRIELRRIREAPWPWLAGRIGIGSSPFGFELALVNLDEHDLAIFGPLTEGEARWLAGIIAEVLKDALPKSGQSFDRWTVSVDAPARGSQTMGDAYLDEPVTGAGSNGSSKVVQPRTPRE